MIWRRAAAVCGVAGPLAFVSAWVVGGLSTDGYDPVEQAISQLAREGAPTRALMTAGLIAFGVLVPVWAQALGDDLRSRGVRTAVTTAGLATLAVAALPLTREPGGTQDALHAVAAATGYVGMALTPLLAAPVLRRVGRTAAAATSVAVGGISAVCLVASVAVPDLSGAFQRTGLTVVDAWHVVAGAVVLARGTLRRS